MPNQSASLKVGYTRNDFLGVAAHGSAMAKQFKPRTEIEHVVLRDASGWWLAAWRDYRGLTGEALGERLGEIDGKPVSKGQISALEKGSSGKRAVRWNRTWVETLAEALETTPQDLIGTNPYQRDREAEQRAAEVRQLAETIMRGRA